MADIVNLRIARKHTRRSKEAALAAKQRHAAGRPEAGRKLVNARLRKARQDLEG